MNEKQNCPGEQDAGQQTMPSPLGQMNLLSMGSSVLTRKFSMSVESDRGVELHVFSPMQGTSVPFVRGGLSPHPRTAPRRALLS